MTFRMLHDWVYAVQEERILITISLQETLKMCCMHALTAIHWRQLHSAKLFIEVSTPG
jgi:hypothetical protein